MKKHHKHPSPTDPTLEPDAPTEGSPLFSVDVRPTGTIPSTRGESSAIDRLQLDNPGLTFGVDSKDLGELVLSQVNSPSSIFGGESSAIDRLLLDNPGVNLGVDCRAMGQLVENSPDSVFRWDAHAISPEVDPMKVFMDRPSLTFGPDAGAINHLMVNNPVLGFAEEDREQSYLHGATSSPFFTSESNGIGHLLVNNPALGFGGGSKDLGELIVSQVEGRYSALIEEAGVIGQLLLNNPALNFVEEERWSAHLHGFSPALRIGPEPDPLVQALADVSPALGEMWAGASDALQRRGPDYARHVLTSLRELFRHLVFDNLAPKSKVTEWAMEEFPEGINKGGNPTRRAYFLFACRTGNGVNADPNEMYGAFDSLHRLHGPMPVQRHEDLEKAVGDVRRWLEFLVQRLGGKR